jgi:hypothetical protein
MGSIHYILLLASLASSVIGHREQSHQTADDSVVKQVTPEAINTIYANRILFLLGVLVVILALYRWTISCVCYIRTLACIDNPTQKYFKSPAPALASIKKHIIYAPLFRKRHRKEFRPFGANLGILPSRFQTIFCLAVVGTNCALSVLRIPWDGPQQSMLKEFRNRTGSLAVVNMIPLMIVAGRNNPLITALRLPFETFNLIHRLFGRIVAAEAIAHVVVELMLMIDRGVWNISRRATMTDIF